ncbi:hypothetical protein Mgra_00004599, partial [Meloidogyne graminicola]
GRSGHKDTDCIYVHPNARAVDGKIKGCYNCGGNHRKGQRKEHRFLPMPLKELMKRRIQLPREFVENMDFEYAQDCDIPVYRHTVYKLPRKTN